MPFRWVCAINAVGMLAGFIPGFLGIPTALKPFDIGLAYSIIGALIYVSDQIAEAKDR